MGNNSEIQLSKKLIITLDGPAGSGKSTTAKALSLRLGYIYLDTGAMYRAITLYILDNNIDPKDADAIETVLPALRISLEYQDHQQRTFLNGADVSDAIREPGVTLHVSAVSEHKKVRQFLVAQQQQIGQAGGYVIDGRDAGTVIFPNADLKFFLNASVEERAVRRQKELARKQIYFTLQDMIKDIQRRDAIDTNRTESPLRKADDAIEIDNTHLTIQDQVENILAVVHQRFSVSSS
jgi:CMP/dCMP kinase